MTIDVLLPKGDDQIRVEVICMCISDGSNVGPSRSSESFDDLSEDMEPEEETYDCVICNQSTPSTAERTIGLVVFLQASSGNHCFC